MKKIYLFLSAALVASTSFAQTDQEVEFTEGKIESKEYKPLSAREMASFNKIRKQHQNTTNNKTLTEGWHSHSDNLYNQLSSVFTIGAEDPLMPDSTTTTVYPSGTFQNNTHAVGGIYHPADTVFEKTLMFRSSDAVTVDSAFIEGFYYYNDASDTQDSLFVTYMLQQAPGSAPNLGRYALPTSYTGLSDVAQMYQAIYKGSASDGQHDGLQGNVGGRYGIQLSQNDTIGGLKRFKIPTPGFNVPAENVLLMWFEFKPTSYTAGQSTDLVNGTGNFNAFRPVLQYPNTPATDPMYTLLGCQAGLDPVQGYSHNSVQLFNQARYNTDASQQTNINVPSGAISMLPVAYYVGVHVSGNSSVSVNELTNDVKFGVYPNPSNGVFNISLTSETAKNINLVVRDVVGKEVMTKNVAVAGRTNETISLEGYSKGIYFLTVGTRTAKLIVE